MRRLFGLLLALGLLGLAAVLGYGLYERSTRLARSEEAVAAHADAVFRSPTSVVAGNPNGDVSVVAFFDYNCPDCRQGAPGVEKLLDTDGKVRLVLKELPVLGPDSEAAARIALAAKRQGRYVALHEKMMTARGRMTRTRALAMGRALGLDAGELARDMDDPAITAALNENRRLAATIGVRGVPFYIVGGRVVPQGEGDVYGALADRVAEVRAQGCRAAC